MGVLYSIDGAGIATPVLPGQAGPGVPTGGEKGQVLIKTSDLDYQTQWVDGNAGISLDKVLPVPLVVLDGQTVGIFSGIASSTAPGNLLPGITASDWVARGDATIGNTANDFQFIPAVIAPTPALAKIIYPAIQQYKPYIVRVKIDGSFAGATTQDRVFRYYYSRYDSSLVAGAATARVKGDTVSVDSTGNITTFTDGATDPYSVIGSKLTIENDSGRTLTVTRVNVLITTG